MDTKTPTSGHGCLSLWELLSFGDFCFTSCFGLEIRENALKLYPCETADLTTRARYWFQFSIAVSISIWFTMFTSWYSRFQPTQQPRRKLFRSYGSILLFFFGATLFGKLLLVCRTQVHELIHAAYEAILHYSKHSAALLHSCLKWWQFWGGVHTSQFMFTDPPPPWTATTETSRQLSGRKEEWFITIPAMWMFV